MHKKGHSIHDGTKLMQANGKVGKESFGNPIDDVQANEYFAGASVVS